MYLSQEELSKLKQSIEEQRKEILSKVSQRSSEEYQPETRGDEADIANSEGIIATMERLQNRDLRLLKKLEETARWLNDENFGYCEGCGDEIGFKRLLVRPTAKLCIVCKENEEQRERGFYHPRPRKPSKNKPRHQQEEE